MVNDLKNNFTRAVEETVPPSSGFMKTASAQILILDDEENLAEMLAEMVQMLGHVPTVCQNPAKALELIATRNFELILSDYHMPVMNGGEFYEELTRRRPEMAGRIIFLTGDSVGAETDDFLKAIGNPHVRKPFQLLRIEEVIGSTLDKLRKTRPAKAEPAVSSRVAIPRWSIPRRRRAGSGNGRQRIPRDAARNKGQICSRSVRGMLREASSDLGKKAKTPSRNPAGGTSRRGRTSNKNISQCALPS